MYAEELTLTLQALARYGLGNPTAQGPSFLRVLGGSWLVIL